MERQQIENNEMINETNELTDNKYTSEDRTQAQTNQGQVKLAIHHHGADY